MILSTSLINSLSKSLAHKHAQNCLWRYLSLTSFIQFSKGSPENPEQIKFTKVYEMPYIRVAAVISRLKLYQTAIAALAIPPSIYLHYADIFEDAHIATLGVGFIGCLVFHGTSFLLNNLVGSVYISKTTDTVKLSYIDYWGRRIDIVCPASDIVPLSEHPPQKYFLRESTVHRYSSPQILKILTEHGIIYLPQAFDKVFFRVGAKASEVHSVSQEEK